MAVVAAEQLRGGGAAQHVIDRAGRDVCQRQAEAGVAQALAGRAQQAGLGGEQVEALQEAGFDAGRDAAVGGGAADPKLGHHVAHRDEAVAADEADQLLVAVARRRGRGGGSEGALHHL